MAMQKVMKEIEDPVTIEQAGNWYEVTRTGLITNRPPDFDEWAASGEVLATMWKASPFNIGDWVNEGQEQFGERWTQATDVFGEYDYHTVANYASICRKVPYEVRDPSLSYSHHQAIAKFPPEEQRAWLQIAKFDPEEKRPLTLAEFRAKIKGEDGDPEPTLEQQIYTNLKGIKTKTDLLIELTNDQSLAEHQIKLLKVSEIVEDLLEVFAEDPDA